MTHPTPWQLELHALGASVPEVDAHLPCPQCAAELDALAIPAVHIPANVLEALAPRPSPAVTASAPWVAATLGTVGVAAAVLIGAVFISRQGVGPTPPPEPPIRAVTAQPPPTAPSPTVQPESVVVPGRPAPQGRPVHISNPVWSADGTHLAYEQTNLHDRSDVIVVEPEIGPAVHGLPVRTPHPAGPFDRASCATSPTWHPEGVVVFEHSSAGGPFRLFYAASQSRIASEFILEDELGGNLTFPAIAPDGSATVFVSDAQGQGDLWIRSMDTGRSRPLLQTDVPELFPTWSRDSRTLYYVSQGRNGHDVFEFQLGEDSGQAIAAGPGDQTRPTAVADGVAFFAESADEWDIDVVIDGHRRTLATDVRLPMRAGPAVSHDGRWIASTHTDDLSDRVFLHATDGSETIEIETPHRGVAEPALTARGDQVLLAYTGFDARADRALFVMDITALASP